MGTIRLTANPKNTTEVIANIESDVRESIFAKKSRFGASISLTVQTEDSVLRTFFETNAQVRDMIADLEDTLAIDDVRPPQ